VSDQKWQIPPDGGHMDAADGIYFQNMTMLEVEARLKENESLVTQRFTQEEVDDLLKGPLDGGQHLYTVAWPPI
jgi:hypothetical protein